MRAPALQSSAVAPPAVQPGACLALPRGAAQDAPTWRCFRRPTVRGLVSHLRRLVYVA